MYLDPGFGSMLVQIIIAAIAACGAYFLMYKKRIAGFFSRKGGAKPDAEIKNDEDGTKE